jgi:hypothetical protein
MSDFEEGEERFVAIGERLVPGRRPISRRRRAVPAGCRRRRRRNGCRGGRGSSLAGGARGEVLRQQADIVDGALFRADQAEVAAGGAGAKHLRPAGAEQGMGGGGRDGEGLAGGHHAGVE